MHTPSYYHDVSKTIRRLLIANRGEPAMRAIHTCKKLQIESVVIYTREDASSEWVFSADSAFEIVPRHSGPAVPYMDIEQIVRLATEQQCSAIWPGWGFLSESAEFAQAVMDAGILWVGPPPKAMQVLGSKRLADEAAREAGFTTLERIVIAEEASLESITPLPMPVVIKPSHGGGGQGQRVVTREEELHAALVESRTLAHTIWGNGELILQQYLPETKHIEFQILADHHGEVCILGTRDCSIQRRNQKVIEEGPVAWLPEDLLQQASAAAISLFRSTGYASAATVETLLANNQLYFLEVNTRLQVEHPVTEESTAIVREGECHELDILAEMLRIACKQPLSFTQAMVQPKAHAIEARLYAENPEADFAPTPGSIYYVMFPTGSGVRVDTALHGPTGKISRHFDPMFSKIIVSGKTREEAIRRLHEALCKTVVLGITTNVDFLRRLTLHEEFRNGDYHTNFIKRTRDTLITNHRPFELAAAIACIISYIDIHRLALEELQSPHIHSIHDILPHIPDGGIDYTISHDENSYTCKVCEWSHGSFYVEDANTVTIFDVSKINSHVYAVRDFHGTTFKTYALLNHGTVQIMLNGEYFSFPIARGSASVAPPDPHASPYGGRLLRLYAKPSDAVVPGDPLFSIESMKMESTVRATCHGFVKDILLQEGNTVEAGETIVVVEPFETEVSTSLAIKPLTLPVVSDPVIKRIFLPDLQESIETSDRLIGDIVVNRLLATLPERMFMAYDIGHTAALRAFQYLLAHRASDAVGLAERCTRLTIALFRLRDEDRADFLLDYLKGGLNDSIPQNFRDVLQCTLSSYGVPDIKNRDDAARHFPRLLLALTRDISQSTTLLLDMIEAIVATAEHLDAASSMLSSLLRSSVLDPQSDYSKRALELLRSVDLSEYYCITQPPVAPSLLQEFAAFNASPLGSLSPYDLGLMRDATIDEHAVFTEGPELADEWHSLANRWFDCYRIRKLYSSEAARLHHVHVFELQHEQNPRDKRLLAIAVLDPYRHIENGLIVFSAVERSSLEAYRIIAQYESINSDYQSSHVLLAADPRLVLQWTRGTRDGSALSPHIVRLIASHVNGFVRKTRVITTEIVINLEMNEQISPYVIEINFSAPARIFGRPPYPLSERRPESYRAKLSLLDEKQLRRGKLLNTDRAKLLFDAGVFEELRFPGVDGDGEEFIGLNVYRGSIKGVPCLAYAGDFRVRGGALGEREGKKLASAVVLAYVSDVPLIGIHDGAGANIEDSVVSLGWAGAYFGAIANTGGFSTPKRFWEWYEHHHEREYFERVLNTFKVPIHELRQAPRSRFLHLHLNLGATVGMLVYGASISSMSIMANHPEMYRVLTGATTVERVLGEKTTNYELGGAPTHTRYSGDIDIASTNEEEAINAARDFVDFILAGRRPTIPAPVATQTVAPQSTRECSDAFVAACDAGSFVETRSNLKGANLLKTGYAAINSLPFGLALLSSRYGIRIARSFKKLYYLFAGCQEFGLPLVTLSLDRWYRVPRRSAPKNLYLRAECERLYAQLTVPKISIAVGPKSLDEPIHHLADILCYVHDGTETSFDVGRADALAHLQASSVAEAVQRIGTVLPFLLHKAVVQPQEEGSALNLPTDVNEPYDMQQLLPGFFDAESFLELQANDGLPLCTGFGRIQGLPTGVIADNPLVGGGAQTTPALSKFIRFNRLCERFALPLMQINDSPAFQPGWKQERLGIQGEGGKSLREQCLTSLPRLSVTLRQNYGGRFIHANLKTLGPNREAVACEGSRIGVMGADGAIAILHQRRLNALPPTERVVERDRLKQEYIAQYLNPKRAHELGYIDHIVPLQHLRREICLWRTALTQSAGHRERR